MPPYRWHLLLEIMGVELAHKTITSNNKYRNLRGILVACFISIAPRGKADSVLRVCQVSSKTTLTSSGTIFATTTM